MHLNVCMATFCYCNQWTTSPSKGKLRCYAKSPTVKDVFQPIPYFTSCAEVTRRELLSHAQNPVKWLNLSVQQMKASQMYSISLCSCQHDQLGCVVTENGNQQEAASTCQYVYTKILVSMHGDFPLLFVCKRTMHDQSGCIFTENRSPGFSLCMFVCEHQNSFK